MAATRKIDWERIEPEWRAGIKSVVQIATEYGELTGTSVSHTAINKHFKQLGIPRSLTAKVMAKADAIVSASVVSGKVSTETTETDAAIIETNAMAVANVRLSHRKRINTQTELVDLLTKQILDVAARRDEFESAIEDETAEDKTGERRARMMKAISLPTHASTAVNLANALKTLVGLERQAFNIKDEPQKADDPLSELIAAIGGVSALPVVKDRSHD